MADSDFVLVKDCGEIDAGPLRTIRARWQRVRGSLRADVRVYKERDDGEWVATRAGLSVEPESLDDVRGLVDALLATREEAEAE